MIREIGRFTVDESAARLRQIECDLHDGAQVRLAALAPGNFRWVTGT